MRLNSARIRHRPDAFGVGPGLICKGTTRTDWLLSALDISLRAFHPPPAEAAAGYDEDVIVLHRIFPFLRWFPVSKEALRLDFMAGLTVALVLIPQSMAYAQLAGMPVYYGLYAAFLPVAVASMWGSSNFLGTGPVAVVSLLTASSLAPLAVPGSEDFIALAILLAFMVGVIQLGLGLFKLGVVVNFLSHPVIVGFTNAAALIIGLSQVSKLFGVPMGRSESFIADLWGVFQQIGDTHWPTLGMGVLAIFVLWVLKKYRPTWPGVLIAVIITTLLSWAIGFERNLPGGLDKVADAELHTLVSDLSRARAQLNELNARKAKETDGIHQARKKEGEHGPTVAVLEYQRSLTQIAIDQAEEQIKRTERLLRGLPVVLAVDDSGAAVGIYRASALPAGTKTDGHTYSIRNVRGDSFQLVGGGEVVGHIPEGLPPISLPNLDWSVITSLLSTALVIALVGFMEAISIAKALAAKRKQKVDPNQELVGQGLANVVGGFTQCFPVSGSFSRSAVNFNAGAVSGMSAVFTALFVLLTLLLLTPLLYHLPQAVLAAIIIMAVAGLINFKAIKHAWHTTRHDGIAAVLTFATTILFAPHLDKGILVGAGLSILLFLYRTMTPRVATLGRFPDGTLRDIKVNPGLPTSPHIIAMRFDGSLYFANVAYFEDTIMDAVSNKPSAKYLLVVGDAINQLDASGEEVVRHLVERLRETGVELVFSGLKKQVLDVMRNTGLNDLIGEHNIFATEDQAIAAIYERLGDEAAGDLFCELPQRA